MIVDGPLRWFQEVGYRLLIVQGADRLNIDHDDVDIEVRFDSGERYLGTFYRLNSIRHLLIQTYFAKASQSDILGV